MSSTFSQKLSFAILPIMLFYTIISSYPNSGSGGSAYASLRLLQERSRVPWAVGNSVFSVSGNPYSYSSYYKDAESKLYYLKARYYSSLLMRFISRDTYDLSNRYAYCGGNPVSKHDPSGHNGLSVVFGFTSFLFALASVIHSASALAGPGGVTGAILGIELVGSLCMMAQFATDIAVSSNSGTMSNWNIDENNASAIIADIGVILFCVGAISFVNKMKSVQAATAVGRTSRNYGALENREGGIELESIVFPRTKPTEIITKDALTDAAIGENQGLVVCPNNVQEHVISGQTYARLNSSKCPWRCGCNLRSLSRKLAAENGIKLTPHHPTSSDAAPIEMASTSISQMKDSLLDVRF